MQRVVILGRGGSVKSTLARRLGEITGLPVVELDKVFWRPGLLPAPPAEWVQMQQEIICQEKWIVDGDLGRYDSATSGSGWLIPLSFWIFYCSDVLGGHRAGHANAPTCGIGC